MEGEANNCIISETESISRCVGLITPGSSPAAAPERARVDLWEVVPTESPPGMDLLGVVPTEPPPGMDLPGGGVPIEPPPGWTCREVVSSRAMSMVLKLKNTVLRG